VFSLLIDIILCCTLLQIKPAQGGMTQRPVAGGIKQINDQLIGEFSRPEHILPNQRKGLASIQ